MFREALDKLKSLWLAIFLKRYVAGDQRPARRYPEEKSDVEESRLVDHFADRNSDPETQAINEKVQQAVARLKSQGKF